MARSYHKVDILYVILFGLLELLLIQQLAFAKFVGQMDYLLNSASLLIAVLRVTLYNGVVITELMKLPRQRDVLLHALEQGLSHSFRFGLCVPPIRTYCLNPWPATLSYSQKSSNDMHITVSGPCR